ncbi:MAG: hypothetical protein OHK0057_33760 [Thermoflexibacter sp.]
MLSNFVKVIDFGKVYHNNKINISKLNYFIYNYEIFEKHHRKRLAITSIYREFFWY